MKPQRPQPPQPPNSCCSRKNISGFISMCLRSVHFVSTLRSGYYVHFAKLIHFDSLLFIPLPYISPTSAPHSFGKHSFPFRKLHSFRFPQALFQRISNCIFFPLRRVHPNNRLKAERKVYYTISVSCSGVPPTRN
jgi:hypothetical protein